MRRRIQPFRFLLFLLLGLATTLAVAWLLTMADARQGATTSADAFVGHQRWTVTRYARAGAVQVHSTRQTAVNWSPQQAAGPPDTPTPGDQVTAWASASQDAGPEWLLLDYAKPVTPREVHVYETYCPGALVKVTAFTEDGREVTAWEGADPTPITAKMGTSKVPLNIPFKTNRIRIHLASDRAPGWNEIDAVGLVDTAGNTQWAKTVTASSTYAAGSPGPGSGNPAELIPYWASLDNPGPAVAAGSANHEHRIADARGWPMLALYSERDLTAAAANAPQVMNAPAVISGRTITGRSGGIVISRLTAVNALTTPGTADPVPIPLRPIYTGLVINTLLYATIWYALYLTLTLPRRFFKEVTRLRRGQCIGCGYDLGYDFVQGCPECGWRRDRLTSPSRRERLIAPPQPNIDLQETRAG
jgi:hypothetical protein